MLSLRKARSLTSSRPPSLSRCQLEPPSSVLRIKPFSPTAQPVVASPNVTDTSFGFVLTLKGSQLLPPSPVSQIMPLASVMAPVVSLEKGMENRYGKVYGGHRAPLSPFFPRGESPPAKP